MSPDLALVLASTALLVLAIAVASSEPTSAPRAAQLDARTIRRGVVSLAVGLLVLIVSRWIIPSVVLAIAAWLTMSAWERRDRRIGDVERTDALASWIENLRDVLIAGDQPIGAIAATVPSCPDVIRGPVRRLATALGHQEPDLAFRRFADDIDDPLGDLVAAGLLVAVQRGARTVAVLSALADQARTHADRRRVLDAERAPVQREVMLLSLIMGCLLVGLLVFGRADYLSPYDTAGGQLFLGVVIAIYAALLLRVQQLARFPRPARFLTSRSSTPSRTLLAQEASR